MAAVLTHEEFRKHLNTVFQIQLNESEMIDLELVQVSEQKLSRVQERFSVVFRGTNESFLGQGMRALEHDQMGRFSLFLVPLGRDDEGAYYEAVFNHLRKDS
jgi:hypothetical protein